MNLHIEHQKTYSRGELLLRFILGAIYIQIPHMFLLFFIGIWAAILRFIAFWIVLFTGSYPQSWFEFQVGMLNWDARLSASMYNLMDGYPAFFASGTNDSVRLEVEYPTEISRGLVLLRFFFGFIYVLIPHGFALIFRHIASTVLYFLAFWVVLFTGEYPERWHAFNVGTLRWGYRVALYLNYMTDEYPPFSGKE